MRHHIWPGSRVKRGPPAIFSVKSKMGNFCPFRVSGVFNVWLSSHIWLFRLVRSQLIATRCFDQRQRVAFSRSPVFPTAACHSVSTSRVAEQIKSHLRAWTGTIRRCVITARQQVEVLPPEAPGGSQHLTFSSFLATDPRWQWRRRKSTY
ncbi:hypothetical protein EYF80_059069 [Liparis tanakae]|uniref:Uncharacterized protein n=1 Tax=Liparis tanakae TaxID=230148 RepID=A0A4Z2EPQ3_9TELE|nr:hypothetical protein EYF80_059069 [Liparis tanakae]